jgi:hypothetical protein
MYPYWESFYSEGTVRKGILNLAAYSEISSGIITHMADEKTTKSQLRDLVVVIAELERGCQTRRPSVFQYLQG